MKIIDKISLWLIKHISFVQMCIVLITLIISVIHGINDRKDDIIITLLVLLTVEAFIISISYLEHIHKHIESAKNIRLDAIPLVPRSDVIDVFNINTPLGFKKVKIAAVTSYNLLRPGQNGISRLGQLIDEGLKLQYIIVDPHSEIAFDFFKTKVVWKTIEEDKKILELSKSIEYLYDLVSCKRHAVEAKVSTKGLYYSIFIMYTCLNVDSLDDYIKIDLYSNNVEDKDRRVLQFYRKDSPSNFSFFEKEFDHIFESSVSIDDYCQIKVEATNAQ